MKRQKPIENKESILSTHHLLKQITALSSNLSSKTASGFTGAVWCPAKESPSYLRESPSHLREGQLSCGMAPGRCFSTSLAPRRPDAPTPSRVHQGQVKPLYCVQRVFLEVTFPLQVERRLAHLPCAVRWNPTSSS